jgi:hypothetical protein
MTNLILVFQPVKAFNTQKKRMEFGATAGWEKSLGFPKFGN